MPSVHCGMTAAHGAALPSSFLLVGRSRSSSGSTRIGAPRPGSWPSRGLCVLCLSTSVPASLGAVTRAWSATSGSPWYLSSWAPS
eukprot:8931920-Pyramimonas_sp.AAC.1